MTHKELLEELFGLIPFGIGAQVARRAGVAPKSLNDWRRGDNVPRLDMFLAVAEAAGLEITLKKKEETK